MCYDCRYQKEEDGEEGILEGDQLEVALQHLTTLDKEEQDTSRLRYISSEALAIMTSAITCT